MLRTRRHFVFEGEDGLTLIHGSTQSFDFQRRGHAWVVLQNGRIWEPISNREWDPEVFETLFRPQIEKTYHFAAMNMNCVQHQHWGPWDGVGGG